MHDSSIQSLENIVVHESMSGGTPNFSSKELQYDLRHAEFNNKYLKPLKNYTSLDPYIIREIHGDISEKERKRLITLKAILQQRPDTERDNIGDTVNYTPMDSFDNDSISALDRNQT